MDKDYIWQADYGNREYLKPVLSELVRTQSADSLQCVWLAVNNNVYNLEFYIMVSYDKPLENDIDIMIELFEAAGLKRRTDVTYSQLMMEIGNRRFNSITLLDEASVDSAFSQMLFFWPERKTLEEKGYHMVPFGKERKVFISHSSKDKPIVEQLIPYLNAADIPLWFDKYDIQIGDSIVEAVQSGIEESRSVIFWITQNFLASRWCKHEMNSYIAKLIEEDARLVMVMCNDVSRKDLPVFLRNIKYIEQGENSIDRIARQIIELY